MNIIPENLKKYQKFISLVLKYRNSDILSAASDKALDELAEDQELSEESNRYTSPEELVEDLKNMGPTYVKIGQTLSTRPDLLPEPYLLALASLQDDEEQRTGGHLCRGDCRFRDGRPSYGQVGQDHGENAG